MRAIFFLAITCCFPATSLVGAEDSEKIDPNVRTAIAKSLALLQKSAHVYVDNRNCFTCHHQALPMMAVAVAREHGFKIDEKEALAQAQFTHVWFEKRQKAMKNGTGVVGGPYTTGYGLSALAGVEWKADDTTAAMVEYLFKTQQKDGRWRVGARRPPLEESDFTGTALAIRGLQLYANAKDKSRAERAIANAREWLLGAKAKSNEDQIYRLLGLKWSGADAESVQKAGRELLKNQRTDGGWAQLADRDSDAYATGQALVALHQSGVLNVDDDAYRRGVTYLLKTRHADGSWHVTSRSRPFQKYFESGFPYKKDQWISICGTSWATMALAFTVPK